MTRAGKRGLSAPAILSLLFLLVPTIVGMVVFGPQRAWDLGRSAAMGVLVDGLVEGAEAGRVLPVLRYVNEEGGGYLLDAGVRAPVQWEEAIGPDEPRIISCPQGPLRPYGTVRVLLPSERSMLDRTMSIWLAGRSGSAAPWNALYRLEENGEDRGVRIVEERVDGRFLANRNLTGDTVQVVHWPGSPDLAVWANAGSWVPLAGSGKEGPTERNIDLVRAIMNDTTLQGQERIDSLATVLDPIGFLRLFAVQALIGIHRPGKAAYFLTTDPASGRLFPILDPDGVSILKGGDKLPDDDLLLGLLLDHPPYRVRMEEEMEDIVREQVGRGAFARELTRRIWAMRSDVFVDKGRSAIHKGERMRYSAIQWWSAVQGLGARVQRWSGNDAASMQGGGAGDPRAASSSGNGPNGPSNTSTRGW